MLDDPRFRALIDAAGSRNDVAGYCDALLTGEDDGDQGSPTVGESGPPDGKPADPSGRPAHPTGKPTYPPGKPTYPPGKPDKSAIPLIELSKSCMCPSGSRTSGFPEPGLNRSDRSFSTRPAVVDA